MIGQPIAGDDSLLGLPAAMLAPPGGGPETASAAEGTRGGNIAGCRYDLPARASAAPAARRHLMRALRAWQLEALADAAQLVTSELVTNAVKASRNGLGPPPGARPRTVAVTFTQAPDGVRVEVWDESSIPPEIHEPDPMDEGGRGLCLVNVLARDWGYRAAEGGGKIVWCEISS